MHGRNWTHAEIRDRQVSGAKRNRCSAGKVTGIRIESNGVDDIEALVLLVERLKAARVHILIFLLHAMANTVLRVPRLCQNGNKIRSWVQVAEVVVAFVIGIDPPNQECPAFSACK